MKSLFRLSLTVTALLAASATQAAAPSQAVDQYAAMCVKAADFPKPHGESDIKGNPKLQEYCKCFGQKFADRAMASVATNKQTTLAENEKEEVALRNSCRGKFGLPLAKSE